MKGGTALYDEKKHKTHDFWRGVRSTVPVYRPTAPPMMQRPSPPPTRTTTPTPPQILLDSVGNPLIPGSIYKFKNKIRPNTMFEVGRYIASTQDNVMKVEKTHVSINGEMRDVAPITLNMDYDSTNPPELMPSGGRRKTIRRRKSKRKKSKRKKSRRKRNRV